MKIACGYISCFGENILCYQEPQNQFRNETKSGNKIPEKLAPPPGKVSKNSQKQNPDKVPPPTPPRGERIGHNTPEKTGEIAELSAQL